jgi:heme exporter protein B
MSRFALLLQRELLLSRQQPLSLLQPLILFLFILIIFPLSMPVVQNFQEWASPLLWFGVLLSHILGLERCWLEEDRDGSLTYFLLERQKTLPLIVSKICGQWIAHGWPFIFLLPLVFVMYHLSWSLLPVYVSTLLPVTLAQSAMGVMLSALLVRIRNSQLLLPTLLLPLSIPLLILGNAIILNAQSDLPFLGQWYLLLAFMIFTLTMTPLITLIILRFTAEL